MSEASVEPRTEIPPPRRCQECRDIKRKRAQALADGDRPAAARMTEAMGVHIWEAHA
ncbi:hypothetical protein GCM10010319_61670 [Streptomyces blastmyceticus]|uniref:Uncharacterized protein n=1 Tax=Streptomyces blastmyceticus TaxID=68180 RepID=A0ABP3HPI0_9ACTN